MLVDYKPTHDPGQDTFKVEYLLAGALLLGVVLPPKYQITEVSNGGFGEWYVLIRMLMLVL